VSTINLKDFAAKEGIILKKPEDLIIEAKDNITRKHAYTKSQIKEHFDLLIDETEKEAHRLYLQYEEEYGKRVFSIFINHLINRKEIANISQISTILGKYFKPFDRFFLSLAQSRKSRAGKAFEKIHNALFKSLDYPFDEQVVINGKPDFLMPSAKHFKVNPPDCIIFTAKRTLRERWRQIVTEGTRGLGFYLATIDENISSNALKEMLDHRIIIVCPQRIRNDHYSRAINVISFKQFFNDVLDPAMTRWKRNKIIS